MSLTRRHFLASSAATAAAMTAIARPAAAAAPLHVVATTGMLADAVRAIGGPDVSVTGLMGPGIDPHSYRQTRSDIVAMTRADLTIWHGLYLEAQMEEFLKELSTRKPVFAAAEEIERKSLISHPDYTNRHDPHVWMDPGLWRTPVAAIAERLAEALPGRAEAIGQRAEAYLGQIIALDDYADKMLTSVPEPARVLVTAHDAFGYFGRAYGFEVLGIQGISTESEAGLSRIAEVVDTLVTRGIASVFVESSVSDRNVRALIEGAAARGHDVRIGGELYSDAMGVPGTYEGTYPGMIDHNVTIIAEALGGTPPPQGMQNMLNREA
ncbi:metal ABC transporter solute-binding protein, Zn/Mn family [Pseudooceanicola aestuarii]|uniref:metal ABC transporter solute-binding protein, Zn/Mn family n=1 Tax=Pseudooceanicola aestuarii TaxID=2697319 RepID=UPI0013D5D8C2|nr:zinc ABC transporter substrate-binding protein [Pseudooceanicola aestuarii]